MLPTSLFVAYMAMKLDFLGTFHLNERTISNNGNRLLYRYCKIEGFLVSDLE